MHQSSSLSIVYHYPYIETGYRAPSSSLSACLFSLLQWHNETLNIWTNLLAACFFFASAVTPRFLYPAQTLEILSSMDLVVMQIAFLAVGAGFSCSALYHIFSAMPPDTTRWLNKLDYAGIFFIGFGGSLPGIYFGFYSHVRTRDTLMFLNAVNAANGIYQTFSDAALDSKFHRMSSIALGACFGLLFVFLFFYYEGFTTRTSQLFLSAAMRYFGALAFGALFYAAHIPERWFPKRFDCLGQSHNIWHASAIAAVVLLFNGWCQFIDYKFEGVKIA